MISIVPLLTYISIAVFVLGCIRKAYVLWMTPIHLRWELYPVAHERNKPYGGSYFEEYNWWTHERERSLLGEIMTMSEEIFLLKGIFENNRKMWYLSFPFHAGLYLLVVFLLFLIVGGVSALLGFPMQLLEFLNSLTVVTGVMGIILTLIGSIGLFLRRAFSAELREYSTPQDYFNLLLIFVIVFTAFMGWITTDNLFVTLGSYVQGLMIFSPGESLQGVSLWIIESIVLFSFYLLYFPFTQMTHPIGKYFMYHQVRWNDEPNIAGKTPKLVKQIENVLNYKVSWNASHIKGEGKKTWVDVATEEVKSDDK